MTKYDRRCGVEPRAYRSETLIFLLFIFLSLIATYPLIFKMKSSIYGYPEDSFTTLWKFWWLKYSIWEEHISPFFCPYQAAPFGTDLKPLPQIGFYFYFVPLMLFFFDEIATYNIILLSGFFLSAVTMYFLAYHFTRNKEASMISGIIYALCPFHLLHAMHHLSLASIQWMPLYLLILFKLSETRSYKHILLCALAFSLVVFFDYYYGYLMAIATILFLLFKAGWSLRKRLQIGKLVKNFRVIFITLLITFILILSFTYSAFKSFLTAPKEEALTEVGYVRPFHDLFSYSVRFFDYLLPSSSNPLLGRHREDPLASPHSLERTLYLGWVGIVLSIIAVREWRRRGRKQVGRRESGQVSKKQRLSGYRVIGLSGEREDRLPITDHWSLVTDHRSQMAVPFFFLLGLVALLFSYAPYAEIGSYRILFPSYFMYKIIPMFRVYARFGILVLLSVSILAGIGLTLVLGRMKGEKKKGILVSSIILLVLIEFAHIPPFHTTDLSIVPEVYQWLSKEEGDFIVAEYPLESYQGSGYYLFYQRVHKKRLINGALPGTHADKIRKEIIDILKPETPGILKYLGAKYLIFHPKKYAQSDEVAIIGETPNIKKQSGLRLVKSFPEAEVYEVIALPIEPEVGVEKDEGQRTKQVRKWESKQVSDGR